MRNKNRNYRMDRTSSLWVTKGKDSQQKLYIVQYIIVRTDAEVKKKIKGYHGKV